MNTNQSGAGTMTAIALMVAAMAGFAVADTFVKLSAATLPNGQVIATLGAGGTLIFAPLAWRRGITLLTRDLRHPAVITRMVAEALGTLGFILALALTTLSTASAVIQTTPLLVTLGAALFLGEPVGWKRWSAVLVGFVGVIVMLQPDGSGLNIGALLALVGAIGLSVRDLSTRFVPPHLTNLALATYGFGVLVPTGLLLLAFEGGAHLPTIAEWGLLAGMVGFASTAYFALTAAMRLGEISAVAPFRYTRLIFAFLLGMLVFDEQLGAPILLGAALVAAAGVFSLYREQRARAALRRQAAAP